MANEFQHKSVGSQLSQTEYEHTDGTGHVFDSQAAGDLAYASSTTVLSRLGIGTAGKVLMVNSGASAPEWQNAITGVTSILNTALVIGRDADNDIDFATDNNIIFRAAGADQIKLVDGVLQPVTDNDIDLGTSTYEFKDAYFDGTVTSDAFAGPLTGDVTGNVSGTAATVTTAAQPNITSLGTLTTLTVDNIIINGTNIGHTSDTDSIAIASDGVVTMNQIPVFSAGINVSGGSIAGTLSTAAQTNITSLGTLTALQVDYANLNASTLKITDSSDTGDYASLAVTTHGATTLTTIDDDAAAAHLVFDVDGNITLDADAGTITFSDAGSSLGTITSSGYSGNAATATALATARAINGVNFDGSAAITVTAAGSTLSDTVPVSKGGTNATSLADKAVLITQDSGTDTVAAAAMSTNGQLLIGGTSGPAVSTLTAGSNITITNADGTITIASASGSDTVDMGDGFVMEDGDGTEVTITENKEVKFVEGNGIDINWTDTDNGTDGDPYDLTFTVDHDAATNFVAAEHYDWSSDISGTATIHANNVTDLHGAGVSGSNNQLLTDDGDGTVTSESNLTFDGTDLTIATGSIQVRTIDYSDGDNAITIADGGGVTFAQDITIADSKGIIIDSTPTDDGFNGIFASFDNATGATINQGEVVYVTGTANQVAKAQANADNTMPAIAIATADVANGASGNFMLHGIVHDSTKFPTLTIGGEVYVSEDTAGLITSTLPASSGDRVQVIGIGLHGDKMLFNPSYDIVERA